MRCEHAHMAHLSAIGFACTCCSCTPRLRYEHDSTQRDRIRLHMLHPCLRKIIGRLGESAETCWKFMVDRELLNFHGFFSPRVNSVTSLPACSVTGPHAFSAYGANFQTHCKQLCSW